MVDGAALGVRCAIVKTPQPGETDGGGAHRTGFEGDVKVEIDQAKGAPDFRRSADHQDFGMGGRIEVFAHTVAIGGDDVAFGIGDHGPDRHLAARRSRLGFGERPVHRRRCGPAHVDTLPPGEDERKKPVMVEVTL